MTSGPFAPALLVENRGPVRLLTLNRPGRLNAADGDLHDALVEVWEHLGRDEEARAVVLTGAGTAFCAGGDLDHLRRMRTDRALREHDLRMAAGLVREMLDFPLPVVAAVNGAAVGLGATLAALSDIVLLADTAYLADPHVSIGLTAADGGALLWPSFMGLHQAKEFLFTGDAIDAHRAVELGLANHVVPADRLLAEALTLATRLAAQPRHALTTTKRILQMHLRHLLDPILDEGLRQESASFDDPEHQAAMRA
ncbi:enoyl-CoA hydratase/isomerase family protein [Actinocorallia longicatena]|uniref:Enoyl-CoA hydratase/isomerase family protein n=1 Tax=Actinocorallia longicatena TaxID=111803 RepID=A0ABP6QG88_9ACTN